MSFQKLICLVLDSSLHTAYRSPLINSLITDENNTYVCLDVYMECLLILIVFTISFTLKVKSQFLHAYYERRLPYFLTIFICGYHL